MQFVKMTSDKMRLLMRLAHKAKVTKSTHYVPISHLFLYQSNFKSARNSMLAIVHISVKFYYLKDNFIQFISA
jgi:hypothetical protein